MGLYGVYIGLYRDNRKENGSYYIIIKRYILGLCYHKIPIYPIFYLLKEDYKPYTLRVGRKIPRAQSRPSLKAIGVCDACIY